MMNESKARELLVTYGNQMVSCNLTTGSGGNLSIRLPDADRILITPSGMAYHTLTVDDIVVCDLQGRTATNQRRASSELGFHLALYGHRSTIGAVVHTHSVYATTLACMHREIPPVHYLVGFSGHKVPLAPYATFGTPELAQAVADSIGDYNALLLANHGLVAVGTDLPAAFNTAEEIELVARIYYQTLLAGEVKLLSREQMDVVLEKFKDYGKQPDA